MAEDYWGGGYWGTGYWATGFWGQGGTAAPPAPTGGGGRRYYRPKIMVQRRKLNPQALRLIKEWLELELKSET